MKSSPAIDRAITKFRRAVEGVVERVTDQVIDELVAGAVERMTRPPAPVAKAPPRKRRKRKAKPRKITARKAYGVGIVEPGPAVKVITDAAPVPAKAVARAVSEARLDAAEERYFENIPRPAPIPEKPFACDKCGFAAATQRGLTKHTTAMHRPPTPAISDIVRPEVVTTAVMAKVDPPPPARSRLELIRNRAANVTPPSSPPPARKLHDPFAAPLPRDPDDNLFEEDDDVA